MEGILVGQKIVDVDVREDSIVYKGTPREAVIEAISGQTVRSVGRKGKYWWLDFERSTSLIGHLGMNGWVYEWGTEPMRLHSHGKAPLDNENGEPRFLKLSLTTGSGRQVAVTDSRRLARMWLSDDYQKDPAISKLGPDAFLQLPEGSAFAALFAKRNAPIKALLLNQEILSGIGNWIADEVLFQGKIAPMRLGSSLSGPELDALRTAIVFVLAHAVNVNADYQQFPDTWMFHHRWGGGSGAETILGLSIKREPVGGRTTAWVPGLQK